MSPKEYLTNPAFCPLPWTGVTIFPNGSVKNCCVSDGVLGNIKEHNIIHIVNGTENRAVKEKMLNRVHVDSCNHCYRAEKTNNKLSNRFYHLKTLRDTDLTIYDSIDNFSLRQLDVRWSNTCNYACVYCDADLSSQWAAEKGIVVNTNSEQKSSVSAYLDMNFSNLKEVYLAGGEPLLIKDNEQLLEKLYQECPDVTLRVNTNLSTLDTKVFQLISKFKNVKWIVSFDAIEQQYEYVRYLGKWASFAENFDYLIKNFSHININMLLTVLTYRSVVDAIKWATSKGVHENQIQVSILTEPIELDVRHLQTEVLSGLVATFPSASNSSLLMHSYEAIQRHINLPFDKNSNGVISFLNTIDARRHQDFQKIFPYLIKDLHE